LGWIAQDINPDGAVGDACVATAEKGHITAQHQATASSPCCAMWRGFR
jgi:creatinine amidohydrolase/Fe(II)-dependent formamide hydrolase-like protein